MKKIWDSLFVKLSFLFIFLVLLGYLLLCMVYALPVEPIHKNVKQSYSIFESEGTYKRIIEGNYATRLDNYTDALMLLEAAHKSEHSPMVAAVLNERVDIKGAATPVDVLLAVYRDKDNSWYTIPYGRYWHGYQIFLKPLLSVWNYAEIRNFLCIVEISLVFIVAGLLVKRGSAKYLLPLAAMWIFLNPLALLMSLQHANMFIFTLVSLSVMLFFEQKYAAAKKIWIIHFFVTGCLTSYFDFLTYPLITLGIPAAYLLSKYSSSFKDSICSLLLCSIVWGIGYALFWASKWIGGSIISGTNILASAANAIDVRSSNEAFEQVLTFWDVVQRNADVCGSLLDGVFVIAAILMICALLMKYEIASSNYALLLLCVYPLAWYLVTMNHAYVHYWFTYRELSITVFSLLTFAVSLKRKDLPSSRRSLKSFTPSEQSCSNTRDD